MNRVRSGQHHLWRNYAQHSWTDCLATLGVLAQVLHCQPAAPLHAADQIGASWSNLATIMLSLPSLRAHHDELVHELD